MFVPTVAVEENRCGPLDSIGGMTDHCPVAEAVAGLPMAVAPSYSRTEDPATAVPIIVGWFMFVVYCVMELREVGGFVTVLSRYVAVKVLVAAVGVKTRPLILLPSSQ